MASLHKRSVSRAFSVTIAVLGLVASFAIPGATVGASTFNSHDGNLVLAPSDVQDWENAPALDVVLDSGTKSTDDAYKGGAKHDDICPDVSTGGIPPNKDDLLRFYVSHEMVGTSTYLYLSWVRFLSKESSASAHMDIEFNQGTTACSSTNKLIERTVGDVLIFYDLEGGGNPVISLAQWVKSPLVTPFVGYKCVGAGSGTLATGCWATASGSLVVLTGSGLADAAINSGLVYDPIQDEDLPFSREFGEAGINITDFLPTTGCSGFSKANLGSRSSGNSADSTMKDFVLGDVSLNNCQPAVINVNKTDGTNNLAGASLGLYNDADNDGAFDAGETLATIDSASVSTNPCTTGATAPACSWQVSGTGTNHYVIHEISAPPGYNTGADIGVDVTFSSTVQTIAAGTIVDTRAPRDVIIQKSDDVENPVDGAVFKAVEDVVTQSSFDAAERTAYLTTTKTCTTGSLAPGTCKITGLDTGKFYWLVEDSRPAGYGPDPSASDCTTSLTGPVVKKCRRIEVPIGTGDIGPVSTSTFTNPRLFKVIVIVCQESDNTLYSSDVTIDSSARPDSLSAAPTGTTEAALCGITAGARGGLGTGNHAADPVAIP